MSTESPPFPDLFEDALFLFDEIVQELARYGIKIDPKLKPHRVVATLSYYCLADGQIYLGLPDPATPVGRLMWYMGRALLACESDEEYTRFLRVFLPRLLAHEVGHYLRHRAGLFGQDKWHEEQVANQLATAVINRRLAPAERQEAMHVIQRALQGGQSAAASSYYDLLGALQAEGKVATAMIRKAETLQKELALPPLELLKGAAIPSEDMVQFLAQRVETIDSLNDRYVSDQISYMNYHLGWLYYDLASYQTATIDEFAQLHLGLNTELLPPPPVEKNPGRETILALYRASMACEPGSLTAGRYFYKRYRTALLAKLKAARIETNGRPALLESWVESLLESWEDNLTDSLDLLAQVIPADLQELLPHTIRQMAVEVPTREVQLPTETDRRMWEYAGLGQADGAAATTLARLKLLDRSAVFGYLPVEVLLQIASDLSQVHLRAGDTMVWEDDLNSDVCLTAAGELSVLVTISGQPREVGRLGPGDVFGEMAFFTSEPRTATVRAAVDSECYVLKAAHLRGLAYQHPIILMQMAQSLARRLEAANAQMALTGSKRQSNQPG